MDEDGGQDVGGRLGELRGVGLPCLLEVEGVGGDGGAGGFDLPPEILGLVHKELSAVGEVGEDVLLEAEDLVLGLLVVVEVRGLEVLGGRVRVQARAVRAALDGAADRGEDSLGREEVHAAVDEVGDVRLGLLDVVQHALGVGVRHDAAKVRGGVLAHARAEDDGLGVALLEELEHVVEGEGAAHVGVEDEEALGLALEDRIAEMVEAACRAERLVLAQVFDGQLGELAAGVIDEVAEDGLVVVADHAHLLDVGHFGNGGQAVPDDGVACDVEQGLLRIR